MLQTRTKISFTIITVKIIAFRVEISAPKLEVISSVYGFNILQFSLVRSSQSFTVSIIWSKEPFKAEKVGVAKAGFLLLHKTWLKNFLDN